MNAVIFTVGGAKIGKLEGVKKVGPRQEVTTLVHQGEIY